MYVHYIDTFSKVQISILLLENSGICLTTLRNVPRNDQNNMTEYSLLEGKSSYK